MTIVVFMGFMFMILREEPVMAPVANAPLSVTALSRSAEAPTTQESAAVTFTMPPVAMVTEPAATSAPLPRNDSANIAKIVYEREINKHKTGQDRESSGYDLVPPANTVIEMKANGIQTY